MLRKKPKFWNQADLSSVCSILVVYQIIEPLWASGCFYLSNRVDGPTSQVHCENETLLCTLLGGEHLVDTKKCWLIPYKWEILLSTKGSYGRESSLVSGWWKAEGPLKIQGSSWCTSQSPVWTELESCELLVTPRGRGSRPPLGHLWPSLSSYLVFQASFKTPALSRWSPVCLIS